MLGTDEKCYENKHGRQNTKSIEFLVTLPTIFKRIVLIDSSLNQDNKHRLYPWSSHVVI